MVLAAWLDAVSFSVFQTPGTPASGSLQPGRGPGIAELASPCVTTSCSEAQEPVLARPVPGPAGRADVFPVTLGLPTPVVVLTLPVSSVSVRV